MQFILEGPYSVAPCSAVPVPITALQRHYMEHTKKIHSTLSLVELMLHLKYFYKVLRMLLKHIVLMFNALKKLDLISGLNTDFFLNLECAFYQDRH